MFALKHLLRRRQALAKDIKSVAEVAGEQIAPGAGVFLWVLAGAVLGAAGAYYVNQTRKNKKAADKLAAPYSSRDRP